MSKWISVKDQLPVVDKNDSSEIQLIYDPNFGVMTGFFVLHRAGGRRKEDKIVWCEVGTGCGCCCEKLSVTHWMPLPERPTEESIL